MSRKPKYSAGPGADQRAKWKAAIAAKNKQQRQQRGRRKSVRPADTYRPGMIRLPAQVQDDPMTTLPRCPFPACPVRWHGGPNRECPDHQNEVITAARELGLLDSFGIPDDQTADPGTVELQ